jgi:lipoyl(octanoyl) transferase
MGRNPPRVSISEEQRAVRPAEWAWLGRTTYAAALRLQERLRSEISQGEGSDVLLLLEHEPTITLGRNANPANILASPASLQRSGVQVAASSRGGDVTFHGPGQLVGYPVFRLRHGVRAHVRSMAEAVVAVLASIGISGQWRESHPGVWVGTKKICAFGVHVHRRVSIHGFALNVGIDLGFFDHIVPCGLRDLGVTSVAAELGCAPSLEEMATDVARALEVSFGVPLTRIASSSSRLQIANGNL